jgi:NADH dehydrogenase FAD-containing subunit
MLETRVKVIDARMLDIDRDEKHIWLHDDSILKYDILVLTMGLQDSTL